MKRIMLGLALSAAAALPSYAQTATPRPDATPPAIMTQPGVTPPAASGMDRRDSTTGATSATPSVQTDTTRRTTSAPVPGANSFTEGQARSRMEGAGFANVTGLRQDDQGIWRGRAMRGGTASDVSLDYQGNVTGN